MKGIYFIKCSILEARKGAKASWSWASIHEGKYFLKEKVLWQIMSGNEVRVWKDRWIKEVRLVCLGSELEIGQKKVASLINRNSNVWETKVIGEYITEEQAQAICVIPICTSGGKDRVVWPDTNDEKYTIKVRYHCLKNMEVEVRRNRPYMSHMVDNKVWKGI